MGHAFFLALRYVIYHKAKTAILITCLSLTIFVPVAVHVLIDRFQAQLLTRAEATPLVIGAKGSRFDLALHALYFEAAPPDTILMREVDYVTRTGYAMPIPLHIRYRARGFPVVGTSLEYFSFRGLRTAKGVFFTRLGDCVIGSDIAKQLGIGPGDALLTDSENVFDLAGSYPLKMRVSGVLAPTQTADDLAVFVDVKTAWIIQGLGHGHQDVADAANVNADVILERDERTVTANAALLQYNEITDENAASFHFHGNQADFPLSAVIVVPVDQKAGTLLIGRYQRNDATAQILAPAAVVDELMAMVFRVKRFFDATSVLIAVATLLFMMLIILLSLRLRRREMETMFKLGCGRFTIFRLLAAELAIVIAASLLIGVGASIAVGRYASQIVGQLLV